MEFLLSPLLTSSKLSKSKPTCSTASLEWQHLRIWKLFQVLLDATKPQDGVNGNAEGVHNAEGADSGRATGSEVSHICRLISFLCSPGRYKQSILSVIVFISNGRGSSGYFLGLNKIIYQILCTHSR